MQTYTAFPCFEAIATPSMIVLTGASNEPSALSVPFGETKTAVVLSPSIPSQFESSNPSSGTSVVACGTQPLTTAVAGAPASPPAPADVELSPAAPQPRPWHSS